MKRCLFPAILAVALFSGCSQPANHSESFSSVESSVSYESSDVSEDTGDTSEVSDISTEETSQTAEPDRDVSPYAKNSCTLINDPLSERYVSFEDGKLVFSGKYGDLGISQIGFSEEADIDFTKSGEDFRAVITPLVECDPYVKVVFYNDGGIGNDYRFGWADGNFFLPDVSDVYENNCEARDNPLVQPLNQVAEYVSIGGDSEKVREVLTEIKNLSDEICAGLDSDYDKLRAISRWVSTNIYYDYAAFNAGVPAETLTLETMLEKKASVCGGYSNMTAALCAAQGIECYNVHGMVAEDHMSYAEDPEEAIHEWNFAVIDGRKIWVDSGWNSYRYLYENGERETHPIGCKYFDISDEVFAEDHKVNYCEYRDYYALLEE